MKRVVLIRFRSEKTFEGPLIRILYLSATNVCVLYNIICHCQLFRKMAVFQTYNFSNRNYLCFMEIRIFLPAVDSVKSQCPLFTLITRHVYTVKLVIQQKHLKKNKTKKEKKREFKWGEERRTTSKDTLVPQRRKRTHKSICAVSEAKNVKHYPQSLKFSSSFHHNPGAALFQLLLISFPVI